jgi:hypothetical protein
MSESPAPTSDPLEPSEARSPAQPLYGYQKAGLAFLLEDTDPPLSGDLDDDLEPDPEDFPTRPADSDLLSPDLI